MPDETPFIDIINEQIASGETKLPAFNKIGMQVQQEAAKKNADVKKIEKVIICDQALTSRVLKLANSSFFTGLEPVRTIREAVVRLGIDEVVKAVALAAHEAGFRSKDPFIQELLTNLWRHSVAVAFGCQWVAKRCGFKDMLHEVFFSGLLHDVGKLFLTTVIEKAKASKKLRVELSYPMINQIMKAMHTEQGYLLMKNWNLPETYCEVARDHHADSLDGASALMGIVRLANSTCNNVGIGMIAEASDVTPVTNEVDFLGLSDVAVAELEVHLEDCMTKLQNSGK